MKKLLELQKAYIAAMQQECAEPIRLLKAAKYAAGNYISACGTEGCTADEPCNVCQAWSQIWDEIDEYLKDNE